jgi:hypothetical protein
VRATLCPCTMRGTNSFLLSRITFHIHAMHDDANSFALPGLVWWTPNGRIASFSLFLCHAGHNLVRIFLRGYLFVWLKYWVSKEEFLFLISPRGFWSSLGQRPHFIHSFLNPNHLKTWLPTHWCPSPLHSQGWMPCKQQSDILTVYQTQRL